APRVGEAAPAAGAEPPAAPPPHARGAARSIRGSRPPATDLALVRGRALGGCHLARAPRPDRRAGAPTASPSAVHLPTGVRAALGWSAQRQHLDARSARPRRR